MQRDGAWPFLRAREFAETVRMSMNKTLDDYADDIRELTALAAPAALDTVAEFIESDQSPRTFPCIEHLSDLARRATRCLVAVETEVRDSRALERLELSQAAMLMDRLRIEADSRVQALLDRIERERELARPLVAGEQIAANDDAPALAEDDIARKVAVTSAG